MAELDDQELRRLNDEITRLQQSMLQLANSQQVGSTQWNKIQTQLGAVQTKYKGIIAAQNSFANSVGKGTVAVGKMAVGAVKVGSSFAEAANAVRQSREDFTSLNPSINLAGSALKITGKMAGVAADALGSLTSGIPVIGGVIGGALSAVGKFAAGVSEALADILVMVGPLLTAEVQRASEAFRAVGQVGGLTAGGLTELMNQSIGAGLSFSQFSAIASNSAEGLAFAFGDASKGIGTFSEVSRGMDGFREGLLSLGVGFEKQNELTSKYLLLQARTGRVETMSAKELAQGSEEYIRKLSTLSRITGNSIDDQQAVMDAQTRNIRLMGAAADIQERIGGEAGKTAALAMQTTSAAIEQVASKQIADGLRDAMAGNLGTEAAQGFVLAAGREGQAAVAALRAGAISDLDATSLIMQGINNRFDALGSSAGIARLVGLGTPMDSVFEGMFNVAQRAQLTATDFENLQTSQDNLTTSTDTTTADMIAAQVALQQTAIAADKMSAELMGPAAEAVKQFSQVVKRTNEEILEVITLFSEEGIAGLKDKILADLMPDNSSPLILPDFSSMTPEQKAAAQQKIQDRLDFESARRTEIWNNIKNLFGFQGRAAGGPVDSNETYLVGENGPEMFKPKSSGTIIPNQNLASSSSATPDYGAINSDLAKILQSSRDGIGSLTGTTTTSESIAGPGGTLRSEEFSTAFAENLDISKEHLANVKSDTLIRKEISDLTIEKLTEIVTAMDRANRTSEQILQRARQG